MSDAPVPPSHAGWRVIFFLHGPPWVREEAVGAFRIHEHYATPMVRDKGSLLVDVDEKRTPYALAAPGEVAESFVERAKEHERRHKKWLTKTRKARAEEKARRLALLEVAARQRAFERSGRTIPAGHPGRDLAATSSIDFVVDRNAACGKVGLGWFLAEHCELGAEFEVALPRFQEALRAFMSSYDLVPAEHRALVFAMQRAGFKSVKPKNRVEGWRGLRLRSSTPVEASRPTEDEDANSFRYIAMDVFVAHCVRQSGILRTPEEELLVAFRTWCIRYRVKPWQGRELVHTLGVSLPMVRPVGPNGSRVWPGISVTWPSPTDFAFS